MKKIIAAAAIAATAAIPHTQAAADKPNEFTDTSVFQEPDPCNPEIIQTTTLTFDVKVHDHSNVIVWIVDFTAETDTGYVGSGRQAIVMAEKHFTDTQTAIATNAEGDRYKVNFHVNGTPNGIAAERFDIRCVVSR